MKTRDWNDILCEEGPDGLRDYIATKAKHLDVPQPNGNGAADFPGDRRPPPKGDGKSGLALGETLGADLRGSVADNVGATGHGAHWGEPDESILDERRGSLPEFPTERMPASMRDWLLRTARGAGVTPAHVAAPLLGISSSLIGAARRIKASKSWSEPMTLWTGNVGYSGTGKTPGLNTIRRAVAQIERDRKNIIAELHRTHDTKAQTAKAARKKWEGEVEAAVDSGQSGPQKPADAMDPGPFVVPRFCVSDSTIERLAVLLQATPRGIAFVADELARLF
jgi:hypothetical protein